MSAATRFLTERSLFGWVQKQNNDKGLAPSYAALWRQYSLEVDTEQNSLQGEPVAPPAREKHKRQRVQRWSRRWRVVQGRYKPGLRLPLETLRQKANVDSELCLKTPAPEQHSVRKVKNLRPQFRAQIPGPVSRPAYSAYN